MCVERRASAARVNSLHTVAVELLRRQTVPLVEDDDGLRAFYRRVLGLPGYDMTEALLSLEGSRGLAGRSDAALRADPTNV